jgi:uncharacterized protein with beta-barrel porin domain
MRILGGRAVFLALLRKFLGCLMLLTRINHSNSGRVRQKELDQYQTVTFPNRAAVRRRTYLAAAAWVSLTLAASLVVTTGPALAAGGNGGGNPGSGGSDAATAAGGNGGAGAALGQGGGGGGAGTAGGTGGDGGGAGAGTGNTAGNTGNNAAGGSNAGGGGGGGGSHGSTGATLPVATSTGTAGGNGGNGDGTGNGGGGGGGGYGAVVTGSGVLGNLGVAVTGGNGGAGGAGAIGGNGGTGGIGLDLTNGAGATFTVNSAVAGGAGGAGGVAGGVAGSGGAGIVGQNLTITLGAAGTVAGGSGANAINFTGGANTLSFTNATSGLTGGIAVTGSLDFAQAAGITTVANNITGGALSKTGAGTITLSGTNSVTSFAVNAGTLVNSGSLTTSGGVTNSASATYAQTAGSTNGGLTNSGQVNAFAGQINDGITNSTGGAFSVAGTVTTNSTFANNTGASLVIGANSLTGITTLTNAGTVSIGVGTLGTTNLNNTGTVSAGGLVTAAVVNGAIDNSTGGAFNATGTVTSNSTFNNSTASSLLAVSGGANYTIAGALTNSGVTASGGGITIASGATLTAGGTTNNAGANFTNTGGNLNGGLTNAGTASNSGFVDGGLTNSGTYGQTAGLSQTTGGTTNTGTINASAGAFNGAIANNAGGIFNVSGTVTSNSTFNNSTTTSRLLVNSGDYVVTNAITNSGTNAAGGILVAAGAMLNANGGITNNGGATFVNNGTTNANTLVNDAGATINNSGTITTTSTTNNGTITGAYAMAGGTLTGTGSVQNLAVNGGTFAPGNGTPGSSMNVTTSLAFQSAATFMVQINPTTASLAVVTGTAALGGATVAANFATGSYVSKQYTIVQATGVVSGMFNPTVANTNLPSNFHTTLSYDTHDAFLNLTLNFAVPGGLNGNQQNVGNALTNFLNSTGSIPLVFGSLTPAGLTQVSGETATGSQQTTFNAMNQFMGVMTDPFIAGRGDPVSAGGSPNAYASDGDASAYTSDGRKRTDAARDAYAMFTKAPLAQSYDPRWSVWAAGFGGSQNTDGNSALGSNNTTSSIAGTAVGADYRFSPFTIAGFALAGGGTSFSVANGGSGRSDLFQAGAFIRHDAGAAYISGALAYGWQDITTNRTVTVAGFDQLRAEFNANAFSGRVESGYRFVAPWVGGIGITPYAAAQFVTFDLPAYAEQAIAGSSNFALAYGAKDVTDVRTELGVRTDKSFAMADGVLTLRGRLAWAHDYDPDRSIAATFQTLPGASFVVNGAAQASDSALVTASVEKKWLNGWSAAATFEDEFSDVTRSYAGKGVVRYAW